jgi:hypothetical protein
MAAEKSSFVAVYAWVGMLFLHVKRTNSEWTVKPGSRNRVRCLSVTVVSVATVVTVVGVVDGQSSSEMSDLAAARESVARCHCSKCSKCSGRSNLM